MSAPRPGDVLVRQGDRVLLQRVGEVDARGGRSIVYRYADNARGISWSGYLAPGEPADVVGHDAGASFTPRSLLH